MKQGYIMLPSLPQPILPVREREREKDNVRETEIELGKVSKLHQLNLVSHIVPQQRIHFIREFRELKYILASLGILRGF